MPSEVEAGLVKEDNMDRVAEWCGGRVEDIEFTRRGGSTFTKRLVIVPTNNGDAYAPIGHYVVKGSFDFYPCDPDTFADRWELIDDETVITDDKR